MDNPKQTEYKFIHFIKIEDKPKTSVWSCLNNRSNEELGIVKWYPSWRQYCYFSTVEAVYSVGCLKNIDHFINQLSPISD